MLPKPDALDRLVHLLFTGACLGFVAWLVISVARAQTHVPEPEETPASNSGSIPEPGSDDAQL